MKQQQSLSYWPDKQIWRVEDVWLQYWRNVNNHMSKKYRMLVQNLSDPSQKCVEPCSNTGMS